MSGNTKVRTVKDCFNECKGVSYVIVDSRPLVDREFVVNALPISVDGQLNPALEQYADYVWNLPYIGIYPPWGGEVADIARTYHFKPPVS